MLPKRIRALVVSRLVCLLLPLLALASTAQTAQALMDCAMQRSPATHCCCAEVEAQQPPCRDQLERAPCCSQHWTKGVQLDTGALPRIEQALAPALETPRLRPVDLFAPALPAAGFLPREQPRAAGPPIIVLYRVYRL